MAEKEKRRERKEETSERFLCGFYERELRYSHRFVGKRNW